MLKKLSLVLILLVVSVIFNMGTASSATTSGVKGKNSDKYFETPKYKAMVEAWGNVMFGNDKKKRQFAEKTSLTDQKMVKEFETKFKTDVMQKEILQAAKDAKTAKESRSSQKGNNAYLKKGSSKIMNNFKQSIQTASKAYGISENLIAIVIKIESNGNPRAVSPKGARGLMQLMPGTAAGLGVKDSFDPHENIMGGTRYLRLMKDKFKDINLALYAYNNGPGACARRLKKQDFDPLNSSYVQSCYDSDPRLNKTMVAKNVR